MKVSIKNIVDFYEKFPEYRGKILVDTPFGYKKILAAQQTDFSVPVEIHTSRGNVCICSKNHRLKTGYDEKSFANADQLKPGYKVLGRNGLEEIVKIESLEKKIALYDIEVDEVHQYYSNDLVSHNSTLFIDSIVFALFGKTLKNTNNKYIPNRNVDPSLEPYVKLYFSSNGQNYSIKTYGKIVARVMGTIGMELLRLDDDLNVIEDLTQSSVNKTKEYIQENLLGCSFDIFKSSIVISYADFMNFYEGMRKDQKRKYVESLFKLDCFGKMFSMIKGDLNDTKKEAVNVKNEILSTKDLIEDFTNKFNDYAETSKKKKEELKSKIIDKANDIKNLKTQLSSIICESSDALLAQKSDLATMISEITENIMKLEKSKIMKSAQIDKITEMIKEISGMTQGLCEKCTALINSRYDYKSKEDQLKDLNDLIAKIDAKLNKLNEDLQNKKDEMANLKEEIKIHEEEQRKKMNMEMSIDFAKKDLLQLKKQYDEAKANDENPFASLLEKAKTSFQSLKSKLLSFNKNMQHLEVLKEVCSENGIKKFIIKDIVKLLNSLIQKYLNEIGCEFIVFFDETFEFKFLTSTGECEFSSFSAGERQRIQIATILAFRDLILNNNVSSNLLIIDELLDANIDTVCIKNVMGILKKKSIESHQNIFIISHRAELADDESIWDSIIKITKENGKSTYEVK